MADLTPCKAIRKFCVRYCTGNLKAPKNCEDKDCPLYPFRQGKNPHRKGVGGNPYITKGKRKKRKLAAVAATLVRDTNQIERVVTGKKRIRIIIEDLDEKKPLDRRGKRDKN